MAENVWFQAVLKDFWSSNHPKGKKQVCQKSYFQDHAKESTRIGGSRELLLSSSDLKYCYPVRFRRKT